MSAYSALISSGYQLAVLPLTLTHVPFVKDAITAATGASFAQPIYDTEGIVHAGLITLLVHNAFKNITASYVAVGLFLGLPFIKALSNIALKEIVDLKNVALKKYQTNSEEDKETELKEKYIKLELYYSTFDSLNDLITTLSNFSLRISKLSMALLSCYVTYQESSKVNDIKSLSSFIFQLLSSKILVESLKAD